MKKPSALLPYNKPLWVLIVLRLLAQREAGHIALENYRDELAGIQKSLNRFARPLRQIESFLIALSFRYIDREYKKIITLADHGVFFVGTVTGDQDLDSILAQIEKPQ